MTNKFKAGDKVVRTAAYVALEDGGFMQEGNTYIVNVGNALLSDSEILLEGSDIKYSCSYFKLVSPFNNMKFRVNSPEHSKEIQEALFEMGYEWEYYGKSIMFTDFHNEYSWLYTDTRGSLFRIRNCDSCSIFDSATEYVVETTKSYKIVPTSETPKGTIEIDGKQYDKGAVLKRLAELETIKAPFDEVL